MAQLLDGPGLAGFGIATEIGRGEPVEGDVVSGMDCDQLALEMGGELGDG